MNPTLCIAMSILLLSGCAGVGTGGSRSWKEQVILPDGRELLVERSHTLGNRFDREIASFNAPPDATAYAVIVPLPKGHTTPWTAEHKDMIPLAVAVNDSTAYLVASPFNCRAYAKIGRPVPPFIFFKYEKDQWLRISVDQFPADLTEANLMISTSGQLSVNEIDKGIVSARTIRRLNEVIVRRKIYRQGIDKYLWGGCLRELEAGWDADVQTKQGE